MTTPFSPVTPPSIPSEHTIEPDVIVTFTAPNILHTAGELNGQDLLTIRNGGRVQIPLSVETWISETPVESPFVLKFLAFNQIKVAGQVVSVLNDACTYNGKTLAPSNPTASQYLALIGTKILMAPAPNALAFTCTPLKPDSALFKLYGKPTLYFIRQVSIVLP